MACRTGPGACQTTDAIAMQHSLDKFHQVVRATIAIRRVAVHQDGHGVPIVVNWEARKPARIEQTVTARTTDITPAPAKGLHACATQH